MQGVVGLRGLHWVGFEALEMALSVTTNRVGRYRYLRWSQTSSRVTLSSLLYYNLSLFFGPRSHRSHFLHSALLSPT
jgi:hypothetical protein